MTSPASSEERISRLLRKGAVPVCIDCGGELESDEPLVTVANPADPTMPWVRCGDCEYRSQFA